MTEQPDFLKFKKILNKNNIFLFDAQYRIVYFRYNKIIDNIQKGGSLTIKKKSYDILNEIKLKNPILLSHFINSLIFRDDKKINYIIDKLK
jgi:hypothetical protein